VRERVTAIAAFAIVIGAWVLFAALVLIGVAALLGFVSGVVFLWVLLPSIVVGLVAYVGSETDWNSPASLQTVGCLVGIAVLILLAIMATR
jgi:hypothetical protein